MGEEKRLREDEGGWLEKEGEKKLYERGEKTVRGGGRLVREGGRKGSCIVNGKRVLKLERGKKRE